MTNPIEQTEIRRRAQEAKEYLIAQIVREAQLENVALSDVERKMLYFTECVETIPDIWEVSAKFDEECNTAEYEAKIAALSENTQKRVGEESPEGAERWLNAVRDLSKEDHYLLVMVGRVRPSYDSLKLFATAIVVIVIFTAIFLGRDYLLKMKLLPAWVRRIPASMLGVAGVFAWYAIQQARLSFRK
jgi:hypothetical protein